MKLHPIVASLRKHKSGVVLIALQIALTLAIVCNAVFIIGQRIERVNRPSGLDESNLFLVSQSWVGAPTGADADSVEKLDSLQTDDLATLRQIAGVLAVTPINSLPVLNSTWYGVVSTKPSIEFKDKGSYQRGAYYFADQHVVGALGLTLAAGRNFTAADVTHQAAGSDVAPAAIMITQALAKKVFDNGPALGQTLYLNGQSAPSRVIGIVARLQTPSSGSDSETIGFSSVIVPMRLDSEFARYAVRTQPGQLAAVMSKAAPALYKSNPLRVIDDKNGVRSFADIRAEAYKGDIGMAMLMSAICLILIAVTAAGIVGLTSFWVGQRRKQIGVRRALGARKVDILHYFQIENLLIAGIGAALGIVLAVGLNLMLMQHMAMPRLPISIVLAGVALVMALGQAAVFLPARRAANVPPVVATRTV